MGENQIDSVDVVSHGCANKSSTLGRPCKGGDAAAVGENPGGVAGDATDPGGKNPRGVAGDATDSVDVVSHGCANKSSTLGRAKASQLRVIVSNSMAEGERVMGNSLMKDGNPFW